MDKHDKNIKLTTSQLLETVRIKLDRLSHNNFYNHSTSKTSVDDYDPNKYPIHVSAKAQSNLPRGHLQQNKKTHPPQKLLNDNTKKNKVKTDSRRKDSKYGTVTEKRNKSKGRVKYALPTEIKTLVKASDMLLQSSQSDINVQKKQSEVQSKEVRLKKDDMLSTSISSHFSTRPRKKYDFPKYDAITSHMLKKAPKKNVEKVSTLSNQQKPQILNISSQSVNDTVFKRDSINSTLQTFLTRPLNTQEIPEMQIDLENNYKLMQRVSLKLESIDFTSLRNQVRGINLNTIEMKIEDPIKIIKQKERNLKDVPDLNNFHDVCNVLSCMERCPRYRLPK
ncbi:uncharacterized protein LOC119681647 [Teleopsis dalmanni]|uniref:uncharacterized protein LOC119664600 n=1 Tax=Teleopsis dalmanni TaxID=139649 RepID=UPI0018CFEBFB|nr:uncharacterized protein LOC119664600 [Teleopsis dalmanni]XP_037950825.1 uncharacterized protein LOC119681647 [Teleopsis dalmanni]